MHSIFGSSKLAADIMVQEYGKYFDIPTVCLRGGCITGENHKGVELHGFLNYLVKCNKNNELYNTNNKGISFQGELMYHPKQETSFHVCPVHEDLVNDFTDLLTVKNKVYFAKMKIGAFIQRALLSCVNKQDILYIFPEELTRLLSKETTNILTNLPVLIDKEMVDLFLKINKIKIP